MKNVDIIFIIAGCIGVWLLFTVMFHKEKQSLYDNDTGIFNLFKKINISLFTTVIIVICIFFIVYLIMCATGKCPIKL